MKALIFAFLSCVGVVFGTDLQLFLTEMGVEHDGTSASMATAAKVWLRPAGKERWEVDDLLERAFVIERARSLGFMDEILPQRQGYRYVLLLGATVDRMRLRLDYLAALFDRGLKVGEVVILVGQRPLDPKGETLIEGCSTEADAMRRIWEEKGLDCPMRFVSVDMIVTPEGVRRPNTGDTIAAWLETHPEPGPVLLISNQPYCLYQQAVGQLFLPKEFSVDVTGDGANKVNAAIILDTVARYLSATAERCAR